MLFLQLQYNCIGKTTLKVIKKKHPFLHLMTSCFDTGKVTVPQINTNLYSVQRIIVFKIQKDLSTRI